jgi:tetratricopeptide (TPR) repeat protein
MSDREVIEPAAPAPHPSVFGGASHGPSPAAPSLERALGPDGQLDLGGLSALEAELAATAQFVALRALYDLAIARAPDPDIGRELMLKGAFLAKEKLADPALAEQYLRRVLSTDAESPDALDALRGLLEEQGRLEEAAGLLDAAIAAAPDAEKVDLLVELAEIAHGGLDQPERAGAALRYAYGLDPERVDVLHRARALFLAESRLADAKAVLDAEAEARLTSPKASAEDARAMAEAYRTLGERLLETPLDHALAQDALDRARQLGDAEALSRLDEIAHLRQGWELKANALRDEAMAARDKRKAAELYVGAAELYLAYGSDPLRAEEALKRALILTPGFPAALRLIERSVRDPARAADAVGKLINAAADVKDPAAKARTLLRAARIAAALEARAADKPLSRDAYARVLGVEPGQPEAAAALAALLEQAGLYAEEAAVLEKYLAATESSHARLGVHLELGRLYAQLLGDNARARAHFEAALRVGPGSYPAAAALRALYTDARDARGVLEASWLLVEHAPDRATRLAQLGELAPVASEVGREELYAVRRATWSLDPRAVDEGELEALALALGRAGELADELIPLAQRRQDAGRWARAARLLEAAGRAREAVEALKRVLALAPGDAGARDALERLLRERTDPQALVDVLESQLARAALPAERAPLYAKLGSVLDRELGDLPRARLAFEALLALTPDDPVALVNLDDLLRRLGDRPAQLEILARREAAATGHDRAELAVRRARLLAQEPAGREAAAEALLGVLDELVEDGGALALLHELAAQGAHTARAAAALEPLYAQRGQAERQVDALGLLMDVEEAAGNAPRVAELARKSARLLEAKLSDTAGALDAMSRAAAADPGDLDTLDQVTRLARGLGRPERAAGLYSALLKDPALPRPAASAVATALGALYDEHLERRADAIEAFRRAVDADGSNAVALAALERLLGAEERWDELAQLLAVELARATEPAAKVELGLRVAALREERAGDVEGAIAAVRSLLASVPGDPRALSRLAQLLEKKGEAASLVDVLDQNRQASADPDVRDLLDVRAADLLRGRLGDPAGALVRYRRVLERRPTDEGALRGLEAVGREVPELASEAAALLLPVYRAIPKPQELVGALEVLLGAATGRSERLALVAELAQVREVGLGQPDAAYTVLARALEEGLLGPEHHDELVRVALAANQGGAVASLLEARATDVAQLRRVAQLYDGPVLSPPRATAVWTRLLTLAPGDGEALRALERLHASGDDPAALAEVLLRRARTTEGAEAVALIKRASAIYEEAVEDLARAASAMEEARAKDPRDRNALVELVRLATKLGDGERVIALRRAEAELVDDPVEKAEVLLRLAATLTAEKRYDEAIDAYEQAAALVPDRATPREGLEGLLGSPAGKRAALALEPVYRRGADWPKLVEVYERLAQASAEPAERVERLLAIRTLWEERLKNPERAFQAAARAFRDAPTSEDVLSSLERLSRPARAHEDLLALYEDAADALPAGSEARAIIRLRLARYLESLRLDRKQTMSAYARVLAERPREVQALEAVVRLGTDLGDFDRVVGALETLADVLEDPAQQVEKLRSAARILEIQAGDPSRIIRAHERILSVSPGEPESLARLESAYGQAGRFRDVERVLVEAIARASSPAMQASLRLRHAKLLVTKLEEPDVALEVYGEVLASQGAGQDALVEAAAAGIEQIIAQAKASRPALAARAATLIEPLWRAKGQPGKLVEAKKAQAEAASDPAERRRLTLEVAALYERDLTQPELAFLTLTRLYEEQPGDPALGLELDRLSQVAETREELADLWAGVLSDVRDESEVVTLSRKVAQIYDRELSRGVDAIPHYERVLASAPDDRSVLDALERLHRQAKDARGVVRVLRHRLDLPGTPAEEKRALAEALAKLLDGELHDVDAALEAHRARLALDPRDRGALVALAELAAREGRAVVLAEALGRLVELAERPEDKAAMLIRLGKVRKDALKDPLGAVEAFTEALRAKKGAPGAMAELTAVFKEPGPARAKAAEVLAPILEESGAYADLITVLEARLGATGADALDPAAKKALLVRIADVYEDRLGRLEHAFHATCRALHEDLADDGLRARAERLARGNGLLEDLAAFYLDEVDQALDHELAVKLRRKTAEFYEKDLADTERAVTEHTRVLELVPGDPETLQALERLYKGQGQFQSLAEVYRRRIAQAEDTAVRAGLMRELARVQAEFLKEVPAAIATLRRLLELTPQDLDALGRLVELCGRENRPSELADALERLIEASEAAGANADVHRLTLARLRVERLDDRVGGDVLIRDVLARDPKNAVAKAYLQERLEEAVSSDDARAAVLVADLLAQAHRQSGDAQALIEVLRVRAGLSADPDTRVALNMEIAALYRDVLKQPELAFSALTQAFRDAPAREELRDALDALAKELLLVEDLVEAYEEALPRVSDPDARLALEARIAHLYEHEIGNRDKALAAWEGVLKRRPMDPGALEALDRLNTALGRWGALTDVIEKRLELAEGDESAAYDVLVRLGQVWEERLDEPSEALDTYRRARAIKPRDPRVLRALARLLDAEAAPDELFVVLQSLAEHAEGSELKEVLVRTAALSADHFGRRDEAIETYKRLLELEPTHAKAHAELDRLYELEERWTDLVQLLERQLKAARDEREVSRVSRRLALIRGTRLGNVDDAVESWTSILRRNPSDVEALEALRKIYRSGARWDDLVTILRKLIPLQTDADGVKSIRFELAEVFLGYLGKRDEAIESAKRVLDVEPHSMAQLLRLEELFLQAGAAHDAVRVMTLRVEASEDPGERVDVLLAIAQQYETKLARRQGAAQAYEKILEIRPDHTRAYESLAALYEAAGDYRKLVDLQNRRLGHVDDPEGRRLLLFAIIEIQEKRLGHKDLAFSSACRAFAEEGADERAQDLAERLADETDGWEILAEVMEQQIDEVPLPRAILLRKRLATIAAERLGEPERAEKQLDLVVSVRPDDDDARAALGGLYLRGERWRDFISLTLDRVELAPDVAAQKALLRDIARVEEERLGERDAAVRTHRRVLSLDPTDEAALDDVIRILELDDDARALVQALELKADRAPDDVARAAVRFRIGVLWETQLDEPVRAIEAYSHVLLLDAGHAGALERLERLFLAQRRYEDLLDTYERQVQLAQPASPERAVAFLGKIARIQDAELSEPERAAITLERALEALPRHVPTMEALEEVLGRLGVWSRLVDIYERHLAEVTGRDKQIELLLSLGEVQDQHLERRDLAEQTYQAALAKDPSHREAIHRLGDLFERQGSWFNALELLGKEARLVGTGPGAVQLHYRIGKINADMLGDVPSAKVAFKRALEIDPGDLASIRALAELFRDEGRWDDVLALEVQEAEHDDAQPATRWQRAAETAFDRLERPDEAKRLYEKALAVDPDHAASLRALADLCFVDESYERAEPLLERLVVLLDREQSKDELCRQYYRLAYISEKLGDDEHALTRYLESYEIDSTYLPTLEGLAAALLRADRWQDAQRIYQTILVHHRESLTDAEVVDLYFQLGDLAARLEDQERARRSFDRALELDPNHVLTLRAYAQLAEQTSEWEEAYEHRSRLIDLLSGEERFAALLLQSKLCRGPIADAYRAIDALSEARRIEPDHAEVLSGLAALYQETSQNGRAIEALSDLLALTHEPRARRDVAMQLAAVEEGQSQWGKSVDALNVALDADALHVQAFERIETILAKRGEWAKLEENYRRMIERLPKDTSQRLARVVLWRSLGDLYRVKLKSPDGARMAYEVVLKLKPDDLETKATLAELLSKRRETASDAIKIYHQLITESPDPAVPIRAVYPIYEAFGQLDRVLCALGSVLLMRVATPDEQRIYEILLKKTPTTPSKPLDDDKWRRLLFHPSCRTAVADILSVLYRGAFELFSGGQAALQLKKKERIDPDAKGAGEKQYFSVWKIVANAMGLRAMDHYHRPGVAVPPRLYPGELPVLFAGEGHEVFGAMSTKHVVWVLSRQVACARPELAPVRALPPDEVVAAVEGAVRLFLPEGSGFAHPDVDPKAIERWTKALQRTLNERALKALRQPIQAALDRGDLKTIPDYIRGVEHTASRAALLFTGDARVADRFIGEQDRIVEISDRRRARELMLFAMSEDYFALRAATGLALTASGK